VEGGPIYWEPLKLSKVLMVEEVKGPYMHPNQRLNPIHKWYDPRDIQLTLQRRHYLVYCQNQLLFSRCKSRTCQRSLYI